MFKSAKRIWLKGLSKEMNVQARFTAELSVPSGSKLYMAGATFYKVYFDGKLIHHGPAPTATGYARVDVIALPAKRTSANITVEVAGYASNSYAAVNQPSYLIAEIVAGDEILAYTGRDFKAQRVFSRTQKTLRYSRQRHFSEVWDLDVKDEECEIEILDNSITYLERRSPLPSLDIEAPNDAFCKGKFTLPADFDEKVPGEVTSFLSETLVGRSMFPYSEIAKHPQNIIAAADYSIAENKCEYRGSLTAGEFCAFACERNSSGLIHLDYIAPEGARIIITHDEIVDGGRFPNRMKSANVIDVSGSGSISFENFEIYGFKYYAVFVVTGAIELQNVYKINIRHAPKNMPTLNTDDEELLAIYDASLESFRSNSLGIFMDCPTRERAGWLCDSYYISRGAYTLTGNTLVEDDFLENFRLHGCKTIPEGMIPMCYPSEHPSGQFIPQWSLWFILQLPYYKKRNPEADLELFRGTVDGLLGFFAKYENELSLLEDLPAWTFVEWSMANKWCAGVNFPTNMLYAATLCAAADMYGYEELRGKAEKIRERVRELSFDGSFFHDQALRDENGKLVVNDNISETCQYYAFYFGTADDEKYAKLKDTLLTKFGPDVDNYPNIEKSNAFMGILLRMDNLLAWGRQDMVIDQIKGYFLHMARLTGTLWEHKNVAASLNHGFPTFIAGILIEILGTK